MSGTSFDDVISTLGQVIGALAPIAAAAVPGASAAIAIGGKIMQGVIALEPSAMALVSQIQSGATVSAADLAAYVASYEAAYQQLNADINAQLALVASPPSPP